VIGLVPVVWRVTLVVLAFHGAWIGLYLASGHEARDFIKIGVIFQSANEVSERIKVDPDYTPPRNRGLSQGTGYDGQFSYYMALDFENAHYYMDYPAYRYGRVLYPALAWAFALGRPDLIPAALIAINWLGMGLATLALAAWLRRRSISPWLALVVGLYPGLLLGVQRDLTEPLAYALVTAGIFLFDYGGRRRLLWAGLAFGLAGLARQTTVVFPLCLMGSLLAAGVRGWRFDGRVAAPLGRLVAFAFLSLAPVIAYTAFLYEWLGALGRGAGLELIPFRGLAGPDWALERQGVAILFVVVPAVILSAIAIAALRAGPARREFAFLLVNVALFVVLLGRLAYRDGYTSVARVTVGVVVAAVVCLPWFLRMDGWSRAGLIVSFALWFAMLPVVAVYGFAG
jgi:hypothetical protein